MGLERGGQQMSELEKNMADYFVVCVREFSKRHNMGLLRMHCCTWMNTAV